MAGTNIISDLQDAGDRIYKQVVDSKTGDSDNELQSWVQQHGLKGLEEPYRVVCHLSAFNHCLKCALYREFLDSDAELEPLTKAETHLESFRTLYEEYQNPAFEEYELDALIKSADSGVQADLAETSDSLRDEENISDTIGEIFETIVPNEGRKRLGQFRTPRDVAEFMAKWAVDTSQDRVLDPGIGAGVLTASVYSEKLDKPGQTNISEVAGVDLSHLSIVMSTTALKILNGHGVPQIHRSDFFDTQVMGAQTSQLDTEPSQFFNKQFDAVISNPPYSHPEKFSEEKHRLNEMAKASSSLPVSLDSPLYVYFYIHAATMLREGGRMAFLTPSEFLETEYGSDLKRFLLEIFDIRAVIMPSRGSSIFDTGRTTACVCLFEKQEEETESETKFVRITEEGWPESDELFSVLEDGTDPDWAYVNSISQTSMSPDNKWTLHMDPDSIENLPELKVLEDIADIKRGIATGRNDYFCLSEAEAKEYSLDLDTELVRIIRRINGLEYKDLCLEDWEEWRDEGEEVYLLYNVEHVDLDSGTNLSGEISTREEHLLNYLEKGLEEGVDDGYLTGNRSTWYRVERREIPDILCDYMSQTGFSFYENSAGVRSLNNLHNLILPEDFTSEHRRALLAYLNSDLVNKLIEQSGRTYSDSLQKIEPNELKKIPAIDPRELSERSLSCLARRFETLCMAARDEIEKATEEVKREIDSQIAEELDISYEV